MPLRKHGCVDYTTPHHTMHLCYDAAQRQSRSSHFDLSNSPMLAAPKITLEDTNLDAYLNVCKMHLFTVEEEEETTLIS